MDSRFDFLWALGAAVVAFGISAALGRLLIPYLHKLKFGQTILDIGPQWHKNKQGTPTMGGIMFIIGTLFSTAVTFLICKLTGLQLFAELDITRYQQYRKIYPAMKQLFKDLK